MTLFLTWAVAPALFGLVCAGCGAALRRAAGRAIPGPLLLPAGYAVVIVVASFTTAISATAKLTTPAVAAVALCGFLVSRRARPRVDWWAVATAGGVLAVYAAPIVLSGSATFAGYLTLDDTATWLALADNALQHGRSIAGLAPSSYSVSLHDYLSSGYPLGAFLPLGIAHQLSRQDEAWLFQPLIAFAAAMLGLSLYSVTGPLVRRRFLRAVAAVVGSSSALLFGYAFWSGIKEVTVAALVALVAALVASSRTNDWQVRDVLPVAVASAAVLDVVAVTGAIWLTAAGVLLVVLLLHRRSGAVVAGALVAATALLAIPALVLAQTFVRGVSGTSSGNISAPNELANLLRPLSTLQLFGIWPVSDFRVRPHDMTVTYALIAAAAVGAAYALATAVRRRVWGMPLYVGATLAGGLLVVAAKAVGHSSPWLVGKALAEASPALVVAAAAGAALLFESGRRVEAAVVAAAVLGGVAWSDARQYANTWLAPRSQLAELQTIGSRFTGQGPVLMTEFQPYGVRHFLRSMDPTGASERRAAPMILRTGAELDKLQYADLDAFQLDGVLAFPTLVLRTSPYESRPPSPYRLVWRGRFYELWQLSAGGKQILEHDPLGDETQPVAVAPCAEVKRLAAIAAANHGDLVAAIRPAAQTYDLTQASHPSSWGASNGGALVPGGSGTVALSVTAPRAGKYGFWIGQRFRDRLTLSVDGTKVGTVTGQLNELGQMTPFGTGYLTAGTHTVELHYGGPSLRPGSGGYQFAFGPLALGLPAADSRLVTVQPAAAASLCGKTLDWIEAVSSLSG